MTVPVEYLPDENTYQSSCDWSDTAPSIAVVEVLQVATESDAMDIAPLHGSVSPDALDTLVARDQTGTVTVSFEHAGFRLTVDSGGTVLAEPLESAD